MNKRLPIVSLIFILLLAGLAAYLVVPELASGQGYTYPKWLVDLLAWQPKGERSLNFLRGLDLQGGLQVLLVADLPGGAAPDKGALEAARQVVENRVNALGLTEPVVQVRGERHIVVELPGISNPEQAVDTIRETALLEFVEAPALAPGTPITTSYGLTDTTAISNTVYTTVMTGAALKDVYTSSDPQTGAIVVAFELTPEYKDLFSQYTSTHIGSTLCIVLDKKVISCPRINSAITEGKGVIEGKFTLEEAEQLTIQLRYGSLPIPLKIESYKAIGPSLGQASVEKSVRAGLIGLLVVFLFLIIYYRLNGVAAALALALYVLLNLMVYKLVPVTLTLPGIAGFLLSAGMAVDANILVFERMKEELRRGRPVTSGMETGFKRAWTSVRDSNLATLLTCGILYFFGNAFAASMVKGFAITLALGTMINIFTAIFVTRTLVRFILGLAGDKISSHPGLLGV